MAKTTKEDLVEAMVRIAGCSKKCASDCLNALLGSITKSLKAGKEVVLTGFGTFKVSKRKARMGRNPQTGKTMKIPAKTVPKFKAGKALKDAVK